ncbi:ABC transporter substrate-binding protein [Neorhizobium galegae]|uniref:Extracellular ligand-binding receptor n=1 Tax=Neorhizobium galegae bv. orientalis str. HAMBI 540 TaxID=1028800 RepID=A0A068T2C5_NEOGA|nr:ABC transporter substrate-binding protein [Neorhizobium galegae]MCQ1855112.1 ABC transporter substrate-binding protein [Neorhizobium galegae]CDN52181.1 Extracellular ligand-binding receptor [Neorhizobium galegae bv. orientalis str. HAMBI 540]CDZ55160.1 Extracellular ligand-binding receptor [Neorhizobium galegae bv. orientalis]
MFGKQVLRGAATAAALIIGLATGHAQETVKVGVIAPMTGPFQTTGKQINAALKAFVAARGNTAGGKKVEIVLRDDGGVADTSLRIAQEMVTTDQVSILAGFGTTPNAMSVATLSRRAKIPQVIMVAATSSIMKASPYILRTSQTIPQIASVIGEWAPENGAKKFISVVSDYGPGIDAEEWFAKTLQQKGGEVMEKVRVPLANPDFAPFLQRVADKKPEALFVFVPSGVGATFMKQFVERGLDKSGIRIIAMSDVADDDLLNNMGDPALGMITGGPYSANHDSPENKAFVEQFKKLNTGMRPNIVAVSAWDALDLIYKTLDKTKGDATGDVFMAAAKGTKIQSPRGPIQIDKHSGDIIQNIYMRTVERVSGELYNNEFKTYEAVKNPAQ